MKIALACDHGGLTLKHQITTYLQSCGHTVVDCGTTTTNSCDYPDFAVLAAEGVAGGSYERGIVICRTGIGMSIAANKVPGVRCALCSDVRSARLTREHNNANVLALGADAVDTDLAFEIVKTFLDTPFSGESRHQKRIDKITEIEKKYHK